MCEKIIGGREVAPHSRPYMVYLSADCGGALIKENWVLTAAHCHRNGFVQAILGAHSLNGNEKGQQIIEVEEQVVHKHYDNSNYANDIMLVKLSKKATINQYVQMLPLPTSEVDPPAGTSCRITGWGRTEYHGKPADTLQEVTVKVISRQECNRRDSYNGKLTPSMMCAGERNGRKDVCTSIKTNAEAKYCTSDLNYEAPNRTHHFCTSSPLTLSWRNGYVYAILGTHAINKNKNEQQIIEIEEQVVHKDYNSAYYVNNLMLVKLSKKATINQYVQMLPLPTSEVDTPADTSCRIAGWGKTEYNGNPAKALQEVNVKVISREECNGTDSYNGILTPSMMCAGEQSGGKDVCQVKGCGPGPGGREEGLCLLQTARGRPSWFCWGPRVEGLEAQPCRDPWPPPGGAQGLIIREPHFRHTRKCRGEDFMWRPESCQEDSRHFRHAGAWPRSGYWEHLGLIREHYIRGRLPPVIGGCREEADRAGGRTGGGQEGTRDCGPGLWGNRCKKALGVHVSTNL
ncbi:GRAA protein, partial [Polypterus senegalus]